MSVKVQACVYSIPINMQSQIGLKRLDLAIFSMWHWFKRVYGYVSMSVEAKSCLECVHTCSQMNEAVGLELSCDSGSCQHCGVCDL